MRAVARGWNRAGNLTFTASLVEGGLIDAGIFCANVGVAENVAVR